MVAYAYLQFHFNLDNTHKKRRNESTFFVISEFYLRGEFSYRRKYKH